MKRTLIVLPSQSVGGAEQIAKMVAKAAFENGSKVTILFLIKGKKSKHWQGCESMFNFIVIPATRELFALFFLPAVFLYIALMQPPNLIFTTHLHINSIICLIRRAGLFRKSIHITRDTTIFSERFSGLRLQSYKWMFSLYGNQSKHISQTRKMEKYNSVYYRLAKERCIILRNPIDPSFVLTKAMQFSPPATPYLFSVGRLIPEKGFDVLINAIAMIKNHDSFIGKKLIIAGDGYYRSNLELLVERMGCKEIIELIGFVDNPYPYMRSSVLNIISSVKEGFPNVAHEMYLLNSNLVSTICVDELQEIPGIILCDTQSPNALAESILCGLNDRPACDKKSRSSYISQVDYLRYWDLMLS